MNIGRQDTAEYRPRDSGFYLYYKLLHFSPSDFCLSRINIIVVCFIPWPYICILLLFNEIYDVSLLIKLVFYDNQFLFSCKLILWAPNSLTLNLCTFVSLKFTTFKNSESKLVRNRVVDPTCIHRIWVRYLDKLVFVSH